MVVMFIQVDSMASRASGCHSLSGVQPHIGPSAQF